MLRLIANWVSGRCDPSFNFNYLITCLHQYSRVRRRFVFRRCPIHALEPQFFNASRGKVRLFVEWSNLFFISPTSAPIVISFSFPFILFFNLPHLYRSSIFFAFLAKSFPLSLLIHSFSLALTAYLSDVFGF